MVVLISKHNAKILFGILQKIIHSYNTDSIEKHVIHETIASLNRSFIVFNAETLE